MERTTTNEVLLSTTTNSLPEVGTTEPIAASRTKRRKSTKKASKRPATGAAKPAHYRVICISMYTRDLDELDAKVAELKKRGFTKASKSQLIRLALDRLDLDQISLGKQ